MERKAIDWVAWLPSPYREKIQAYIDSGHRCVKSSCGDSLEREDAHHAIDQLLFWRDTDEGYNYWYEAYWDFDAGRLQLRDPEPTHWIYDVEVV